MPLIANIFGNHALGPKTLEKSDTFRGNWYEDPDGDIRLPVVTKAAGSDGQPVYTSQILVLPVIPGFGGSGAVGGAYEKIDERLGKLPDNASDNRLIDGYLMDQSTLPAGTTALQAVEHLKKMNARLAAEGDTRLSEGHAKKHPEYTSRLHEDQVNRGAQQDLLEKIDGKKGVTLVNQEAKSTPSAPAAKHTQRSDYRAGG